MSLFAAFFGVFCLKPAGAPLGHPKLHNQRKAAALCVVGEVGELSHFLLRDPAGFSLGTVWAVDDTHVRADLQGVSW